MSKPGNAALNQKKPNLPRISLTIDDMRQICKPKMSCTSCCQMDFTVKELESIEAALSRIENNEHGRCQEQVEQIRKVY